MTRTSVRKHSTKSTAEIASKSATATRHLTIDAGTVQVTATALETDPQRIVPNIHGKSAVAGSRDVASSPPAPAPTRGPQKAGKEARSQIPTKTEEVPMTQVTKAGSQKDEHQPRAQGNSSVPEPVAPDSNCREECLDYTMGRCSLKGRCPLLHVPWNNRECKDFKLTRCPRGRRCPWLHVPLPEECGKFKLGLCSRGNRCNRLHGDALLLESTNQDIGISDPHKPAPQHDAAASQSDSSHSKDTSITNESSGSEGPSDDHRNQAGTIPSTPLTHDTSGKEVCLRFLRDRCKNSNCPRSHPPRHEWHMYLPLDKRRCQVHTHGQCPRGGNCGGSKNAPATPATSKSNPESSHLKGTAQKGTVATEVLHISTSILTNRANRPEPSAKVSSEPPLSRNKSGGCNTENDPMQRPAGRGSRSQTIKAKHEDPCIETSPETSYYTCEEPSSNASSPVLQRNMPGPSSGTSAQGQAIRIGGDPLPGKRVRRDIDISRTQNPEDNIELLTRKIRDSVARLKQSDPTKNTPRAPTLNSARPSDVRAQIPAIPPGLGFDNTIPDPRSPHIAQSSKQSIHPPEATNHDAHDDSGNLMSILVEDSVIVLCGAGFEVREIETGFESKTVVLRHVPVDTSQKAIERALAPFGEVTKVQITEHRPDDKFTTVKARFANHEQASNAAAALDRARVFGTSVSARTSAVSSTSLGKGVVQDGDVYIELPAPHRTGYAGYKTAEAAYKAISLANGAVVGDMKISAAIHDGLPQVGYHTVKFTGLPATATQADLKVFNPDQGVMFERCNYTSLDGALKGLQAKLEEYGDLVSITAISPPFINQTIRAWAHYSSPAAADAACRALHLTRQHFVHKGPFVVRHFLSVTYTLPGRVFESLIEQIYYLRNVVNTAQHRCDIRFHRKKETRTVATKLVAESLPSLTRLKTSFERILRGHTVLFHGETAWDPFFARPVGDAWLTELESRNPGVSIQRDIRKELIRLYGPPRALRPVQEEICMTVARLRSQKVHTFPLAGRLIDLLLNPDLTKLQQDLGPENVVLDHQNEVLKVRGNEDAVRVAILILRRVKNRGGLLSKISANNRCPVCLDEVSLPVTLDCGHTWCKTCFTQYLSASVDTRTFPITCLGNEGRCSQPISLKVARQMLPAGDFYRIAHAAFRVYIHSRPNEFYHCPTPDCPQIYRSAAPDTVLQCPSCLIRICANCHVENHEGVRCPDQETVDRKLFEEWTSNHDVKKCPGCSVPIEREAGCNHMTCTRCRTHICWVCMATFSVGGAVYDHMRAMHGGIGL